MIAVEACENLGAPMEKYGLLKFLQRSCATNVLAHLSRLVGGYAEICLSKLFLR